MHNVQPYIRIYIYIYVYRVDIIGADIDCVRQSFELLSERHRNWQIVILNMHYKQFNKRYGPFAHKIRSEFFFFVNVTVDNNNNGLSMVSTNYTLMLSRAAAAAFRTLRTQYTHASENYAIIHVDGMEYSTFYRV